MPDMETLIRKQSKKWISPKVEKITVEVICYLFVLLFIYAATSKLIGYDKFQLQISKSPIITDFALILAWLVPLSEIIIAVMLLFNRTIMLGFYAALTLMLLFTFYIYAILNYSETIPCSCGGVLQKMSWSQHLVFNGVFVGLAVIGILLQTKIDKRRLHSL